jgi:membrane protease YdiL (CAAX protease family)
MKKLELTILYFLIPILFSLDIFSFKDRWIYFLGIFIYISYQTIRNKLYNKIHFDRIKTKDLIVALIISGISLILLKYLILDFFINSDTSYTNSFYLFIIFLYPLVSVPVQELFFRFYFFERFSVEKNNKVMIVLNIISFAIYHYMYGGYLPVILTAIASIIFTFEYLKSRNFLTVWLYHALMGIVVFISGFTNYFTDLFMK